MYRGREPSPASRGYRHIEDMPKNEAASHVLARRAWGLIKLDRSNDTHFRSDSKGWRHFLRVNLDTYRNLREGKDWNAYREDQE